MRAYGGSGKEFQGFDLQQAQRLQQLAEQLVLMRRAFEAAHQVLQQPDGTVGTQAAQLLVQRVRDQFGVQSSDTATVCCSCGRMIGDWQLGALRGTS